MHLLKPKPLLITLLAAGLGFNARAATYKEVGGIVVVEAEHFDSRVQAQDNDHAYKIAPYELTADEAHVKGTKALTQAFA